MPVSFDIVKKEIREFPDKAAALAELSRLKDSGFACAVPPIMGLLLRIGYFEDQSVLEEAIPYLEYRIYIEDDQPA